MQSNNGDLYFRAGIDLDGFNVGADAMERRMDSVTSNVVSSAGQMDDAISKIGSAFTRIAGAGAATGFVKQMFNVRSEMQNTEAMLRVFLGSAEKADQFFKSLQGYAYNNVFEFKDLAQQSAQLLAYGNAVETVIPTLNKLSEVAAGTNVPLEELVSIWNKVKVTDKMDSNTIYSLGAKGIDVRQAIADIKELETGQKMLAKEVDTTGLKFNVLQKIIDLVATDGGMFDGMMQEKMKTLGDSYGLMQDNLTNMFNKIGEQNQGLLKSGMDVANYLIENYEEVAKVLGTLVVAYGAAKAANIALNVAQKNGTGVAVIDNTVWAIRGNLLKANAEGGKNITATIRQISAAQKEEIATLKAAITEQEHEEVIRKSRIANLNDVLDASQKARLAQMGLNVTSEEYIPIAMSMLDKEQQMQMAKADLTRNNASYIEALREVVGMHGTEINSIDDRIEAATKQLALAEKEAEAAADTKEQLEKKVAIYKDYYDASLNNIEATDLQERQEALETAQSELEAAAKAAETAAETRNTAQKKLNELQTKKNAMAEGVDTVATKGNAAAKNILSVAVGKLRIGLKALWAVMKANPVGAVITVVTSLYTIISHFVNKSKEAKEAQAEENKEMAEFHREVNMAKDRLNTLQTALSTATRGSSAYNQALKQVNDMCKEYNVELINTNDNIQTQKEKYDALKTAIEGVTAAKLREQFTTTALQNQSNRNEETMATFRENMQNKHLFKEGFRNVWGNEMKFNTMWNLMLNKAQEAASGDDHTNIAAIDDLIKAMQKISGFQVDRNGSAASYLRTAFKGLVESARETQREVKRADDALKVYEQTMNAHKGPVKEVTTSVADLNKQLEAQKRIIADLEKKAKTTGLTKDEEEKLSTARTQQSNIEKRLKTFGIDKSIKKASDDRRKYLASLSKEDAMLIFDAEDARIAALQEGAERELATLQNNFARQMTELDFERKEIDQKRKELKLPAINWEETDPKKKSTEQLVDEQKRRALEEAFDRNTKRIFDSEIEQRKRDYETYTKWVENVGQDAADRHFERLIEKGRSFEEFIKNEIARLNAKSLQTDENGEPAGLTDAEWNYLDDLYDEQRRKQKQSYAQMEEDMNKEIAAASTLAEKLEIINKWLEKIKGNGDEGTVKDGYLFKFSQMRTELLDEMELQFNQTYERYAKKRVQTEQEYNRRISELSRQHRTEEAKAVRAEMEQAIQDLDTDFLKGLVSTVFKNPTKKNMREAMKTLQTIQNMTLEQFNAQFGNEQFKLTEEQFGAIKDSIGDINTEIKKLGQGYTLADAFKEIRDGRIEGDMEKVARGTEFMQNAFSKFASVVSTLSQALNDLADASNNDNLKNTAKTVSKISNVIGQAGSWAGTGASIGGGWGALIGAVLGGGIGIITEIVKGNAEKEERIAKAAEVGTEFQHEVASQLVGILGAVQSLSDTVSSLNYEQYRKSLLGLIEELKDSQDDYYKKNGNGKSYWSQIYDAVRGNKYGTPGVFEDWFGVNLSVDSPAIWKRMIDAGLISKDEASRRDKENRDSATYETWSSKVNNFVFGWLDDLLGNERTHIYDVDEDDYRDATARSVANYINWMAGQYAQRQKQLMQELEDLYNSNSHDSLEYFNKENEVYREQLDYLNFQLKWLEVLGQQDTDAYRDLVREITNLEHDMAESLQHMAEGLFGIDAQSLIEDWISIFQEFGDNVDGAFEKIDEGIDKMIANMLLKRKVVEPLFSKITSIFEDYATEVGKDHEYTEDDFKILGDRIKEARGYAYDAYQRYLNALEVAGVSLDSLSDASTMTGSLQQLSEETGGVIAGRLNAGIINIAEGNEIARQSLLVQYEMRNYLGTIQADVAIIKQRVGHSVAPAFNENMNYGYAQAIHRR